METPIQVRNWEELTRDEFFGIVSLRSEVFFVEQRIDVPDLVEITVTDNGIGISQEDQERIFERFYRVDYGRSRESGGTGLGLSIVRHIALAHKGSVRVWSRPRRGSTFTLRLPAQPGWSRRWGDPGGMRDDQDPDHRGRGLLS